MEGGFLSATSPETYSIRRLDSKEERMRKGKGQKRTKRKNREAGDIIKKKR